ncbi:MAG TPA: recombinase family protein [Verrucomicrobiae bacterium]|nr:recombinase family protein [Verrucomicrobiae bacterium]
MKDNIALNKSVGIWIRVSTEDQAQGDSPEHHEERARSYAKSRGWEVMEIYDLAGQSGKSVMDHPECKRMMKDVVRGHITGLIFSKLARLSRSRRELEDFGDFFPKHNADLVSLSEAIDTSTAGGRMFFHLLAVFAQWEREEIAERVTASVLTRAKLGKSINGTAPYGYQWKDRKLVIKDDEAAIRRKAYELFAKYRRKGQVAKELNGAGYRTREKNIWRDTSIQRILAESSAKGLYLFNTMRLVGTWQTETKPESEWGRVECPPIVSVELWDQVNQIMEEQLKSWKKPGKPPVHLFSGLAFCSCGSKMYVAANNPKYFCRKCRNKIPITDLENVARHELKAFFGQAERIAGHLEEADRNLAEKSALLDTHRREIAKVKEEMHHTHQLYLKQQISGDGFRDLYSPAEQRLKQLQAELPKLEAEVDLLRVNKLSAEDVIHESNTLYDRWPNLPTDDKRRVVEAIIEKITIGNGEIDITFSHVPSSEELCKSQSRLGPG